MEPASLAMILGASAASSAASIYNNRQNIRYAQEANDEMIGLANTAHQREVRDLIAAGLNPILSATGSGASTPNLRVPDLQSIDGGIASNAGGLARYTSEQQRLLNEKTLAETGATVATAENLAVQNKNLLEQNREISARVENINADTDLKKLQLGLLPYKGHITSEIPGVKYALEEGLDAVKDFGASAASFGRSAYDSFENLVKKLQEMKAERVESAKSFERSPSTGSGRLDRIIKKAFTPSDRKTPPRSEWYWIDRSGKKHYYFKGH